MSKLYEIKEYNQVLEPDEQFLDTTYPLFDTLNEVLSFLALHDVYGKVFQYDKEEYLNYFNANDADVMYLSVPEPSKEWNTTEFIL